MKHLPQLCLIIIASFLVSCAGLPSKLPASVTDPAVIETYNKAKQGDGNALYQMSLMYRKGLKGFPKSNTRARNLLSDATNGNPPSPEACFDYFRSHINHSKDTFVARAIKRYRIAFDHDEPRAIALFDARNPHAWDHDPIREMRRLVRQLDVTDKGYVVCPVCQGLGETEEKATKTVGSYIDYANKTKVYVTKPTTVMKRCGYCSMPWRKTPYPGLIKG